MAEILISLTIIGIIAAITLPALRNNINETTWSTQRKALYSRMSQAIAMMPSLNGYGIGAADEETASKAAEVFITDGLSKVLKITNVCDSENLKKCGFPDKFTKHGKNAPKMEAPKKLTEFNNKFIISNYSQIDTNSAAFETANGESILTFYNPNCSYTYGFDAKTNKQNLMQPTMCANFIYDLNGRKGPNKVGKDIGFITAFYPTDSEVVAPIPIDKIGVYKSTYPAYNTGFANAKCRKNYGNDTKVANITELMAIFVNNKLSARHEQGFMLDDMYYSSTQYGSDRFYVLTATHGSITKSLSYAFNSYNAVYCVKR